MASLSQTDGSIGTCSYRAVVVDCQQQKAGLPNLLRCCPATRAVSTIC